MACACLEDALVGEGEVNTSDGSHATPSDGYVSVSTVRSNPTTCTTTHSSVSLADGVNAPPALGSAVAVKVGVGYTVALLLPTTPPVGPHMMKTRPRAKSAWKLLGTAAWDAGARMVSP